MTVVSLRSADFAPRHRVAEFQVAAANICKLAVVPEPGSEYRSETLIGILPGAVIADTAHSACRTTRDHRLAAETGDNVLIHIPRQGAFRMKQAGGTETICGAGDVYVDPTEVPGVASFVPDLTRVLYVSIPRDALAGRGDAGDRLLRRRTRLTPQWRLFRDYVLNLHRELPHLRPEHLERYAGHVQDLALLALAPEAARRGESNGLRHARLTAMMRDVERHLTTTRMGIAWIAGRHGISERYVRALFAEAGTTFNDHVAARRLALAHRLLGDPRHAGRSISDIAFAAGFGDISWFNARFRRTYGMTPSAVRAAARNG